MTKHPSPQIEPFELCGGEEYFLGLFGPLTSILTGPGILDHLGGHFRNDKGSLLGTLVPFPSLSCLGL